MSRASEELVALAAARRLLDRRIEELVGVCWSEGVERAVLADAMGVSRAGLYRRFSGERPAEAVSR